MSKPSDQELRKRIKKLEKADAFRSQIEDALRASETKYRTLTENITVGIFRSTPGPKGIFLEVNPALVKMFGYKKKRDLFIQDVAKLYQKPKDRKVFSDKMLKEGFVRHEEFALRKKDGTPIIVSETAIAVKNDSGKVLYFDGIVEDITERKKAERDLRVQKAYFEKLFNSAPEAIVLHDNNDFIVNVNDEFTKLFGYTREEAIGKPINSLVAPADMLGEASMLSNKVIHGKRVEVDSRRKRKDGTCVDVWILGAPIFDDGKQMGVYAIYRDITERKKAEEDLRIQKTFFERLFNSAPEAIVLHGNDDRIVNVNQEFTRLFGYSREEAFGKRINDLIVPGEFRQRAEEISRRVIAGERVELDAKRKRKDGTLIDVSILGAPIVHGGKQLGDYAIYRDITERKRAEEDLHIQKMYHEKLFNSAPEAIVLHDNDDRVINVNEEFMNLFGYTREEAIGRPINELVAPDEFKDEANKLSHKVIHGERVEIDSKRKRKDGSLVDVWIMGAPIIDGGKQMGVYAIYRDITERRKADEARIRSEEESRTARNIQMNFLPSSDPVIPGYDIAGRSIPALNVGGDYYDFIRLDEHRLAIGLGDVSGHGLAASLVMANLQATVRGQAYFGLDPDRCLERANKLLFRSTDSRTFISLFFGILDTQKHTISYANAGQDLPVLFSADKNITILRTRGIALGMKEDVTYQKEEILLKPGDRLLIYTDGIAEAMNDRRDELGEDRLREIVLRTLGRSARETVDDVIAGVGAHVGSSPQNDDMTLVLLKRG
jgi:PAS domain S-box-containing protein